MTRTAYVIAGAWLVLNAFPAVAAEYLDTVVSPVVEIKGERGALTSLAATCVAQLGGTTGSVIHTNAEAGTVVSPILFAYTSGGVPWSVKATLTVEAKDGRIRLTHTNLAQKQGGPAIASKPSFFGSGLDQSAEGGWMRIGKWRFGGGDKAQAEAQTLSQLVADCIRTKVADDF